MIIVVTGSRTWTNESQIKKRMEELEAEAASKSEKLTIVHGNAPKGADRMCAKWADAIGVKVLSEPAQWKRYGKFDRGAGFARNIKMLVDYKPDRVEAFRSEGRSNGTDHCIKEARKRGIEVKVNHERIGS